MTRFTRLSHLLLQYHQVLQQERNLLDMDRRHAAGTLAVRVHGAAAMEVLSFTNLAALGLSQERLTVHTLDRAAIAQVNETDLRTLPTEPPRLLQSGWCIETFDLGTPLFSDVVCLGGYSIEEKHWLIAESYPDGLSVGQWRPRWGEQDIEGSFVPDQGWLIEADALPAHRETTLAGIRFALTLGALLDAEGTPLISVSKTHIAGQKRRGARQNRKILAWTTRTVSLSPTATPLPEEPRERQAGRETREGLHAEKRVVRGFLRRQPHGPGNRERKWVYVSSFESTRYVGERPSRIYVTGEEDAA